MSNQGLYVVVRSHIKIFDKEVLLLCLCIGKCNNVEHRNNIGRFHRMICKVIEECSMLFNTKSMRKTNGTFCCNELNDIKKLIFTCT